MSVDEIKEVLAQHDKALSDKNLTPDGDVPNQTKPRCWDLLAEEKWVGPEIRAAYTRSSKTTTPHFAD